MTYRDTKRITSYSTLAHIKHCRNDIKFNHSGFVSISHTIYLQEKGSYCTGLILELKFQNYSHNTKNKTKRNLFEGYKQ